MTTQTPTQPVTEKKVSHKASITGAIMAILALIFSAIAYFLTHAESRTHTEVTTAVGKIDSGPVADIASKSVSALLSMPFIIGGLLFASIAIVFIVVRLRKVKVTGLVFSLLWLGVSVWAIRLALVALDVIKAHPN